MIRLPKWLFLCSTFLLSNMIFAQKSIQEVQETVYSISSSDSIIRYQTNSNYDTLGRLIKRHRYYYARNDRKLVKEDQLDYNPNTKVLSESITTYKDNSSSQKRLETKYLVYAKDPANSKRTARLLYDELGEIVKEDTLTYNTQEQPTQKCTYDYRGNTSLVCEEYDYNKQNEQCRWRTYSKWTTIDGRGEVVEKKSKRRDYKFRYNKNGDLKRAWGNYFKTKMCRKLKYAKNGILLEDKTVTKRTLKRLIENKGSTEEEENTKKTKKRYKTYKQKEVHLIKYQNGKMIEDLKTRDGDEIERTTRSYQDTLIQSKERYVRGNLAESEVYEYGANQQVTKKTKKVYNTNNILRFSVVSSYDADGKLLKEKQFMAGKIYSTTTYSYDSYGNLKEKSLSSLNNPNFEKTMYIYKYF